MKRYLLFIYCTYYPCGGFNDYIGAYSNLYEAKELLNGIKNYAHGHIFDLEEGKIIYEK